MSDNNPSPPSKMTGGQIAEEARADFYRLKNLIEQEADVHRVHSLRELPDDTSRWAYLIQTPFATFPKFVVGTTDLANETPEILSRHEAEWGAQDAFSKLFPPSAS